MIGKYLLKQLNDLRRSDALCDLELISGDGNSFKVHHIVFLALNPRYYERYLMEKQYQKPTINKNMLLSCVNYEELKAVIEFIYGKPVILRSRFDVLKKALEKLSMDHLIQEAGGFTFMPEINEVKTEPEQMEVKPEPEDTSNQTLTQPLEVTSTSVNILTNTQTLSAVVTLTSDKNLTSSEIETMPSEVSLTPEDVSTNVQVQSPLVESTLCYNPLTNTHTRPPMLTPECNVDLMNNVDSSKVNIQTDSEEAHLACNDSLTTPQIITQPTNKNLVCNNGKEHPSSSGKVMTSHQGINDKISDNLNTEFNAQNVKMTEKSSVIDKVLGAITLERKRLSVNVKESSEDTEINTAPEKQTEVIIQNTINNGVKQNVNESVKQGQGMNVLPGYFIVQPVSTSSTAVNDNNKDKMTKFFKKTSASKMYHLRHPNRIGRNSSQTYNLRHPSGIRRNSSPTYNAAVKNNFDGTILKKKTNTLYERIMPSRSDTHNTDLNTARPNRDNSGIEPEVANDREAMTSVRIANGKYIQSCKTSETSRVPETLNGNKHPPQGQSTKLFELSLPHEFVNSIGDSTQSNTNRVSEISLSNKASSNVNLAPQTRVGVSSKDLLPYESACSRSVFKPSGAEHPKPPETNGANTDLRQYELYNETKKTQSCCISTVQESLTKVPKASASVLNYKIIQPKTANDPKYFSYSIKNKSGEISVSQFNENAHWGSTSNKQNGIQAKLQRNSDEGKIKALNSNLHNITVENQLPNTVTKKFETRDSEIQTAGNVSKIAECLIRKKNNQIKYKQLENNKSEQNHSAKECLVKNTCSKDSCTSNYPNSPWHSSEKLFKQLDQHMNKDPSSINEGENSDTMHSLSILTFKREILKRCLNKELQNALRKKNVDHQNNKNIIKVKKDHPSVEVVETGQVNIDTNNDLNTKQKNTPDLTFCIDVETSDKEQNSCTSDEMKDKRELKEKSKQTDLKNSNIKQSNLSSVDKVCDKLGDYKSERNGPQNEKVNGLLSAQRNLMAQNTESSTNDSAKSSEENCIRNNLIGVDFSDLSANTDNMITFENRIEEEESNNGMEVDQINCESGNEMKIKCVENAQESNSISEEEIERPSVLKVPGRPTNGSISCPSNDDDDDGESLSAGEFIYQADSLGDVESVAPIGKESQTPLQSGVNSYENLEEPITESTCTIQTTDRNFDKENFHLPDVGQDLTNESNDITDKDRNDVNTTVTEDLKKSKDNHGNEKNQISDNSTNMKSIEVETKNSGLSMLLKNCVPEPQNMVKLSLGSSSGIFSPVESNEKDNYNQMNCLKARKVDEHSYGKSDPQLTPAGKFQEIVSCLKRSNNPKCSLNRSHSQKPVTKNSDKDMEKCDETVDLTMSNKCNVPDKEIFEFTPSDVKDKQKKAKGNLKTRRINVSNVHNLTKRNLPLKLMSTVEAGPKIPVFCYKISDSKFALCHLKTFQNFASICPKQNDYNKQANKTETSSSDSKDETEQLLCKNIEIQTSGKVSNACESTSTARDKDNQIKRRHFKNKSKQNHSNKKVSAENTCKKMNSGTSNYPNSPWHFSKKLKQLAPKMKNGASSVKDGMKQTLNNAISKCYPDEEDQDVLRNQMVDFQNDNIMKDKKDHPSVQVVETNQVNIDTNNDLNDKQNTSELMFYTDVETSDKEQNTDEMKDKSESKKKNQQIDLKNSNIKLNSLEIVCDKLADCRNEKNGQNNGNENGLLSTQKKLVPKSSEHETSNSTNTSNENYISNNLLEVNCSEDSANADNMNESEAEIEGEDLYNEGAVIQINSDIGNEMKTKCDDTQNGNGNNSIGDVECPNVLEEPGRPTDDFMSCLSVDDEDGVLKDLSQPADDFVCQADSPGDVEAIAQQFEENQTALQSGEKSNGCLKECVTESTCTMQIIERNFEQENIYVNNVNEEFTNESNDTTDKDRNDETEVLKKSKGNHGEKNQICDNNTRMNSKEVETENSRLSMMLKNCVPEQQNMVKLSLGSNSGILSPVVSIEKNKNNQINCLNARKVDEYSYSKSDLPKTPTGKFQEIVSCLSRSNKSPRCSLSRAHSKKPVTEDSDEYMEKCDEIGDLTMSDKCNVPDNDVIDKAEKAKESLKTRKRLNVSNKGVKCKAIKRSGTKVLVATSSKTDPPCQVRKKRSLIRRKIQPSGDELKRLLDKRTLSVKLFRLSNRKILKNIQSNLTQTVSKPSENSIQNRKVEKINTSDICIGPGSIWHDNPQEKQQEKQYSEVQKEVLLRNDSPKQILSSSDNSETINVNSRQTDEEILLSCYEKQRHEMVNNSVSWRNLAPKLNRSTTVDIGPKVPVVCYKISDSNVSLFPFKSCQQFITIAPKSSNSNEESNKTETSTSGLKSETEQLMSLKKGNALGNMKTQQTKEKIIRKVDQNSSQVSKGSSEGTSNTIKAVDEDTPLSVLSKNLQRTKKTGIKKSKIKEENTPLSVLAKNVKLKTKHKASKVKPNNKNIQSASPNDVINLAGDDESKMRSNSPPLSRQQTQTTQEKDKYQNTPDSQETNVIGAQSEAQEHVNNKRKLKDDGTHSNNYEDNKKFRINETIHNDGNKNLIINPTFDGPVSDTKPGTLSKGTTGSYKFQRRSVDFHRKLNTVKKKSPVSVSPESVCHQDNVLFEFDSREVLRKKLAFK